MSVSEILKSGLAEAKRSDSKEVGLQYLADDQVEELADATLAYLRIRPGRPRPDSVTGWNNVTAANAGVMPWWAREADLRTEAQRRPLRRLRREVYDLLEERGLIVQAPGRGTSVEVSPVAVPTDPPPEDERTGGAWLLRADPAVWDLGRFIADGHRTVHTWAVLPSDRSMNMRHGQRVFLWATGDGTTIAPGLWGVGWIVGPCVWRTIDDGYWSDHIAGAQTGLYADVAIQLLLEPVDAKRIHDDPLLSGIEVLRDPFVANPTVVSPDEERALLSLSGIDPVQPAARP